MFPSFKRKLFMERLVLNAKTRTEKGKGAAKLLRAAGKLPAVMYNSKGESIMLTLDEGEFHKVWRQATPTTLISLAVDGKEGLLAFIKATDYNIILDKNIHVDFHVIDEDKDLVITMNILTKGNPVGVRDGGVFEKGVAKVEIKCLPKDLPVRIIADVSNLGLNENIYIKDLPFDSKITVLSDSNAVVAGVRPMR